MSADDLDRLKVHRRELVFDGERFTVLSPRPATEVRFATNHHHDTWHVISDVRSARFLGRVMWAMAFQRSSPTIFAIDREFLLPNPFDAEPSDPIVVVNSDLATPSDDGFGALRSSLPLAAMPSGGTVRLQTRGLAVARDDPEGYQKSAAESQPRWDPRLQHRWIRRTDGMVALAAPPTVLRDWALTLSTRPSQDGEIQVLENFTGRVERAIAERDTS